MSGNRSGKEIGNTWPRNRRKSSNRSRITDAMVTLMNERGGAVNMSQIAEYLDISPGNLYYHFKNREEILRDLFDELTRDLDDVLKADPDERISIDRLVSCYIGGTKVLWRYRFFFASATDFIVRDGSLAQKYQEFSSRSKRYMQTIILGAVKEAPGVCALSSRQCEQLAETMWVLWVSWPRYSELSMPGQLIGEADIGRGLEQISFVLAPYLGASYFDQLTQRLRAFVRDLDS